MLTASFAGEGDASVRQAAQPGGPHPYLIGEGEARAALDSVARRTADGRTHARHADGPLGSFAGRTCRALGRALLDHVTRQTLRPIACFCTLPLPPCKNL